MARQTLDQRTCKRSGLWWLFLIPAVFFSPILTTGLFRDDLVYALEHYREPHTLPFIWNSIWNAIHITLHAGRFTPVSVALWIPMFHVFDFNNPAGYHLLQVLLISLSCYLFASRFVEGGSGKTAAVLLICAMSATYSGYHDPYVSYHLFMPVFTLFFLGAALSFERHLETGSARDGVAALILYLLALGTYEIAYPMILVFLVQILTVRPKCKRTWTLFAVVAIVLVGFQRWLRMQANGSAESLSIHLSPWPVIRTFVLQAFSCFPLAPQIGRVFSEIRERSGSSLLTVTLVAGILIPLAAFSVYLPVRFFRSRSKKNALLLIGLIIWLAPALAVSVSPKYQQEVAWAIGYLPRYVQIFGLALVILGLAGRYLTTRTGLAALTALSLLVFGLNVRTIRKLNRSFAAAKLLCNVVEDRAFLKSKGCRRLFVIEYYIYSGDQFRKLNPDIEVHEARDGEKPAEGDCVLLIHAENPGSEWAVLGVYQDGMVRDTRLLLGHRLANAKTEAESTGFKEWTISAPALESVSYEKLWESVSSGRMPFH